MGRSFARTAVKDLIDLDASILTNSQLRERGWLPCVWKGSVPALKAAGIKLRARASTRDPMTRPIAGQITGLTDYWAPRWAVLTVEAEPCNDEARTQLLRRAMTDPMVKAALQSMAALIDGDKARAQMATFVMSMWEPEDR